MRTLGRRIIHLDPPRGFAAESVGAAVLYTTAFVYHAPVSTTHVITSAVMGAGATKRFSAVRWGVARSIVIAWVLTFPAAGLAAALVYWSAAGLPAALSGRPRALRGRRRPRGARAHPRGEARTARSPSRPPDRADETGEGPGHDAGLSALRGSAR